MDADTEDQWYNKRHEASCWGDGNVLCFDLGKGCLHLHKKPLKGAFKFCAFYCV